MDFFWFQHSTHDFRLVQPDSAGLQKIRRSGIAAADGDVFA
jgi:hypothetical protein